MFKNRNSSQRPNDELLAAFKENFRGISQASAADATKPTAAPVQHAGVDASAGADGPHLQPSSEQHGHHALMKDISDLTPLRFPSDQWRLTPSVFDPNAFSLQQSMGPNPMGYYTPTPGGINTVYHNPAAGDLHTPGLAFQLGTPLSMPIPDNPLHAGSSFDQAFQHQLFHQQSYDPNHLYPQQSHHQHQQQQQQQQHAFPPSLLVHKDSGFGASHGSPGDALAPVGNVHAADMALDQKTQLGSPVIAPGPLDQFRYHVTLNAPTAMVRSQDEVPITYLNKGQAYTMTLLDSMPVAPTPGTVKYRTVIRISFEDDEQRQKPSSCWQLWKEGRGLAESHHRGGKLQAVEFVDPHPGSENDPRRPQIDLENASFDSFAVTWAPPVNSSSAECAIAVRFNFLSTDFSHSKGVKGIPVRLCAKTHMLLTDPEVNEPLDAEVCYCKVKLFRDHGAERKLSNDVAHVKKSIDKLKQQLQQVESGIKDVGRRKRTSIGLGKPDGERPSKIAKHKRTWSVSSGGSTGKGSVEDDLREKLIAVQEMFSSTRPVSVLYLKGHQGDDPDKFPVALPGDSGPNLSRTGSWDRRQSDERSESGSTLPSPVATTRPLPRGSMDWPQSARSDSGFSGPPIKVQRGDSTFEAMDVVPEYAPPEPISRAVACVYVKRQSQDEASDNFHRAVYLWHRTLEELRNRICSKFHIDPARIERVLHVVGQSLEVEVDDDVADQLPEGQDMLASFEDVSFLQDDLLTLDDLDQKDTPLVLKLFY